MSATKPILVVQAPAHRIEVWPYAFGQLRIMLHRNGGHAWDSPARALNL